ncbi:putative ABC transport system permease protein [Chryseolinea serpens]|uniref:Putative ABC transport system permease protein n=1 Tax=Chryseolinea serpens TaxID=947013 RepID=A0A1M5VJH3_9BACT|nr:ABC transporter permease [Chryseolinea serpens]SHH75338.1 putative ABC transport system permease protein [Chryseolinea serpens]
MFKNYVLTTLRNISRRKGFSMLNVLGLSIGLAASLLIMQYVKDEFSFDDFHANKENIYRVQYDRYRDNELVLQCATTFPKVAPALLADYPEVQKACRLYLRYGGGVIRYDDIQMKEDNLFTADQSFFDVFSYSLLKGDRATALKEPNTAVVEEETARKYFGNADPMGKRIKFGNREEYEITGVIRSPENSHLKFSFLLSYPTLVKVVGPDAEQAWGWYDFYTYIQLSPGADPKALEAKFPEFIKKYGAEGDDKKIKFSLQRLTDIHLNSDLLQEARVNGNGRSVYFLSIIAFFILVIAWVNYINLATARAVERAKEVGVRKAIGAGRLQLMGQFIAEALIVNFGAVITAVALMSATIPLFNTLSGKALTTSILTDPTLWYTATVLFLAGSALSGLYPAFVLSSYQPARVLKGSMKGTHEGLLLRKMLVVMQFVASVALIAGTLIVYNQLQFMQNRDLGVDIDQVLVIHAPGVTDTSTYVSQLRSFKSEVQRHPNVQSFTASSEVPGNLIYWTNGGKRIGGDQELPSIVMYRMGIDHDFFGTYKNKVLAGRVFSEDFTADTSNVILNRKAVEVLGFNTPENAVGGQVKIGDDTLTVVGVVENYHQEGLKSNFRQTAFHLLPENHSYYSVKVQAKDIDQTLAYIKEKYSQQFPENPFDYFFLDTFFQRQYQTDRQFGQVFGFFALLAIFVASLGLFGLASFTASQRTKEIGIRKVLGSTVPNIFLLLSKDFLKLVIFANVIAIPLVVYFMDKWLHTFAFRINIGYWIFLVSAVLTLLIALITVSFQSIRAAMANPVKSLRYE